MNRKALATLSPYLTDTSSGGGLRGGFAEHSTAIGGYPFTYEIAET